MIEMNHLRLLRRFWIFYNRSIISSMRFFMIRWVKNENYSINQCFIVPQAVLLFPKTLNELYTNYKGLTVSQLYIFPTILVFTYQGFKSRYIVELSSSDTTFIRLERYPFVAAYMLLYLFGYEETAEERFMKNWFGGTNCFLEAQF